MAGENIVGLSLNSSFLNNLEKADKRMQDLISRNDQFSKSAINAYKSIATQGVEPFLKELENQKAAMQALSKVRLSKNSSAELRQLKQEAKEYVNEINKVINTLNKASEKQLGKSLTGMFTGGDKSVNKMTASIQQMQQMQKRLNLNTVDGKKRYEELARQIGVVQVNLTEATKSSRRFGQENKNLLNTGEQLKRAFTGIFAVSAISGYVNNLIKVRGEFEMQHRSLQILVGDLQEANNLWNKTVALAVKSPFRVKELVSYTKQLAAYRVETEKLYDVNKMLADVSSGLGVDMQRLILAYGQVKAANFLRGTELRQFSEAGVNMLGELSKLYSEIENRTVSVGDVFERVSKRLVTFEDVHEVFQRITSEGGTFYKMQEKQSETLRGQIMNLRDSIDLMLNDIGSANDGILKRSVATIRSLVENWEQVKNVLIIVAGALSIYKLQAVASSVKILALATSMNIVSSTAIPKQITMLQLLQVAWGKASLGVKKFGSAMKAAFSGGNVWLLAITALITAIYELATWNDELNEKIKEVNDERDRELSKVKELIREYENLKKAQNEGKISDKKDILSRLISQAKELKIEIPIDIDELSDEEIDQKVQLLNNAINESINFGAELGRQIAEGITGAEGWFHVFGDNLKTDLEELTSTNAKILGGSEILVENYLNEVGASYDKLNDKAKKYYDEIIKGRKRSEDGSEYLETEEEFLFRKIELLQKINKMYGQGAYTVNNIFFRNGVKLANLDEKRLKILSSQKEVYYEIDKVVKSIKEAYGVEDFSNLNEQQQIAFRFRIDKEFEKMQLDESTKRMAAHYLAEKLKINVEINYKEEESLEDWQKRVLDAIEGLGDLNGVIFGGKQVKGKQKEQVQNYVKSLVESANDIIKEFDIPNQQIISKEDYELAKKQLPILEKIAAIVGIDLNKNKEKEEQNKILKNRIDLIKKLNEEYLKLNKTFDSSTSKEKVSSAYKDTFIDAFEGTGINLTGLVIDKSKLKELQKAGQESGTVFSEAMIEAMNDIADRGTYIRSATEDVINFTKKQEKYVRDAYWDAIAGIWTVGYGTTSRSGLDFKVNEDTSVSEIKAEELLLQTYKKKEEILNKLLDKHRDLILTQEQYNALLDAAYQGEGAKRAVEFAYAGWDEFEKYLKEISKYKQANKTHVIVDIEQIKKEWDALDSIQKKIALTLKWTGIRSFNKEKQEWLISSAMQKRALERSAMFSGGLELVETLQKAAIDVSEIKFENIEGVIEALKMLEPIAKKEGKEAELTLSKAISDLEAEIGITTKVSNDEILTKQIEDLFNNYELTLKFQELGFPSDFTEQLFDFKQISFKELKENIEAVKEKFVGTDMEKKYKDFLERLKDIERENLEERAKEYKKYLEEAMSNRVKIRLEELKKLRELEESKEFTDPQKKDIREGIRKDTQKQLDIDEWEQFKESEIYSYMFEDLENVGNRTISALLEKLEGLKDALSHLPADKYKEIVKEIEKLEDLKLERNPLKGLSEATTELETFKKEYSAMFSDMSYRGLEQSFLSSEEQRISLQQEIDDLNTIIRAKEQGRELTQEEAETIDVSTEYLSANLNTLYQIKKGNEELLSTEERRAKAAKEGMSIYEQQVEAVEKVISKIHAWGDALTKVLDGMDSILDAFGVAEEDASRVWIGSTKHIVEMIMQIASLKLALVQLGIQANSALGIIGIIGIALTTIGAMFSAIFQAHDKGLEKRIEKWQNRVERLQKSYETLEKRISEAYQALDVASNERLARSNIKEQIFAYQQMIYAEESKKKSDEKKIQEWYDTIADLREQEKELVQENIESFGGSFDFRSTTREFVDAWIDAFKETGNGLYGLQENFSDFFSNVIAEQAVMQGASAIMKPLLDSINSALANDYTITDSEFNAIGDLQEQQLAKLDEFLEGWYSRYGDYLEVGEMSGLQRGIEGVSESTAQIIEELLNSMRFYVADSNTQLKTLVNAQIGASDANTPNPMLEQLKIIASQTSAIYALFDSVVGTAHPRGRSGIRVFVD